MTLSVVHWELGRRGLECSKREYIEGEYGRAKYDQVEAFAQRTGMSLLGVSHAASEYSVMETQLPRWFSETFGLAVHPIREPQWWRSSRLL
jgi:hypothetical protein